MAVLAILALVGPARTPAHADAAEQSALTKAIGTIVQFRNTITGSMATVNSVSLGPYAISGSCDFDCIFHPVCFKTENWSWRPDFSGTRVPLQNMLQAAQQQSQQFEGAFRPMLEWQAKVLPAFSQQFTGIANDILAVNAAIQRSGGTATPQQRQQIADDFQKITSALQQSSAQLNPTIQAMARFLEQQKQYQQTLASLRTNLQASVDGEIKRAQDGLISQLPCGQNDAQGAFSSVQQRFDQAFGQVQASFASMQNTATAANQAVGVLTGTLLSIQSDYSSATQQVQQAASSPNAIIQNLHLNIAQSMWADLAAYAAQQMKQG